MSNSGLERLDVWRKAHQYALQIVKLVIPNLPPEENWALTNQLRRSAQSISANIAEGYGRYYYQETIRFCYIARGSLTETLSHLLFAKGAGYIPENLINPIIKDGEDLLRLITGYVSYLKRTRQGANELGSPGTIKEDHDPYSIEEIKDEINNLEG
jgi:four helix bundle protein